jgi:hypothetical protein
MDGIEFQEALFTLPGDLNRYNYHQLVQDMMGRGANIQRNYIYDVRPLGNVTAVTVRALSLPKSINPQTYTLSIDEGMNVKGSVVVSMLKRVTVGPRGNSHTKQMSVDNPCEFVSEKLIKAGLGAVMLPEDVRTTRVLVKKKNSNIPLDCGRANFLANVLSVEALKIAFLDGVGRSKAFGFGMLYLPDRVFE